MTRTSTSASTAERARVSHHVGRGQRRAWRATPPTSSRASVLARGLLLDALQDYWREGRFPKNPGFPWHMPVFVDAEGTRCAIAHLMELGGAATLVREIAARHNFAYLRELAADPRVTAWLSGAGITIDEAAEIQPSYCPPTEAACVCGGSAFGPGPPPAEGVADGDVSRDSWGVYFTVREIFGDGGVLQVGVTYTILGNITPPNGPALLPISRAATPEFFVGGPSADDGGFSASSKPQVGAELLIAIDASGRPLRCTGGGAKLPITKAEAVAALRAKDCVAAMGSVDSDWTDRQAACDSGCGCAAVGVRGEDAGVAILLAVVGALMARRRLGAR